MISQARARARAARQRHLQQRQTVIFGSLIAALLVIGLAAGAMWVGIVPSPFNIAISSSEPKAPAEAPPCPPKGATYVPLSEISANVLNGTDRRGLAGRTAKALTDLDVTVGRTTNASSNFPGVVRIIAGPAGLPAAYTLSELFTNAQVEADSREDETVDVILGSDFDKLRPKKEVKIDEKAAIPTPADCTPVSTDTKGDSDTAKKDKTSKDDK